MWERIEQVKEAMSQPENFWPVFWNFIHMVTLTRGEIFTPEFMEEFMWVIWKLIPCDECQENFYMKKWNLSYTTENYLEEDWAFKFFHMIHNLVNKALEKKEMSFKEVIDEYSDLYQRD